MFSYYLVSSEASLEYAENSMRAADVNIPRLCAGYRTVWEALGRHDAQPPAVSLAAKQCALQPPIDQSILAKETFVIGPE